MAQIQQRFYKKRQEKKLRFSNCCINKVKLINIISSIALKTEKTQVLIPYLTIYFLNIFVVCIKMTQKVFACNSKIHNNFHHANIFTFLVHYLIQGTTCNKLNNRSQTYLRHATIMIIAITTK